MKTTTYVRVWSCVQLAATLLLVGSVGVLAWFAIQTHDALCSFRSDIEGQYAAAAAYVEDVAAGRRRLIEGITLADLEIAQARRRATLDSLSDLDCG